MVVAVLTSQPIGAIMNLYRLRRLGGQFLSDLKWCMMVFTFTQ